MIELHQTGSQMITNKETALFSSGLLPKDFRLIVYW